MLHKLAMRSLTILISSITVLSTQAVLAKGKFDSKNFSLLYTKAQESAQACGISSTLVALDIDNTLLTTNQDLGGDAWFSWQSELISSGGSDAVAPDFPTLLRIHETLLSLSGMHVTDEQNQSIVKKLQNEGYPVFALTSRGPENHDPTLRELIRNEFNFVASAIGPEHGYPGTYLPYDSSDIEAYGISRDEATRWKLSSPREVRFSDGVMLGSGQHKGALLRTLLTKTSFRPCAIVFIDDTPKNIERVWDAFNQTKIDITVIRYGYEDENVERFNKSDKSNVKEEWNSLRSTLSYVFGYNM